MKAALGLLAALVATTACSSSPTIRYYTLSAETGAGAVAATTRPSGGPYVIDAVSVPDLLDRPQIVLRTSTNAVEVLDYDRWAAPLPDQLERVLAADLSARLGADAVVDPGLPTNLRAARRITVSIVEFDARRDGQSSIEASWVISDANAGSRADSRIFRKRHLASATGHDVQDIAATMSGLVQDIAEDIAATIATGE